MPGARSSVVTGEPRAGQFEQRRLGRVRRFDGRRARRARAARAAARPCAAAGRPPRACSRSCGCRAARRTASTSAPGCAGRASTSSCAVDDWHVVGRRGGLGGAGDRLRAWLRGASAPGLAGERRAVVEGSRARRRQRRCRRGSSTRFRRSGLYHLLAVVGPERRPARGRGARRSRGCSGSPRAWAHVARARRDRRVRARGRAAAVRDPGGGLGRRRRRSRGSRRASATVARAAARGASSCSAWNPYTLFDAGFQLSFAAVVAIFLARPAARARLEGYPLPRELARGGRRLGRLQRRDRADPLAAVRARCRCSASSRTRSSSRRSAPLLGLAFATAARRSGRAAARGARSPG